jgi:hypothetical protein
MTTKGPLGVYYDRWNALDKLIATLYESYESHGKFPRQQMVLHLLNNLRAFGKGQFEFFYFGFDYNNPKRPKQSPRLQMWDEFPPEDVLSGVLDQIGHDLDLIQKAATQRILADKNVRDTLANADKLAWRALQPAIDYGVIAQPATVLTHFQKSAEFYSIPYANIAIIAIPFTCTSKEPSQDYLAIPHEVGHYVYRHPTNQARMDLRALRLAPPVDAVYQPWIKEIFEEMCADIYGCLIAGPVMALDFESLSLANSQADFRGNDGEHPNAALRPLIYCEVLGSPAVNELTIGDWQRVAQKLSDRWKRQLVQRHIGDFVIQTSRPEGQNTLIAARLHTVDEAFNGAARTESDAGQGPLAKVIHQILEKMLQQLLEYVRTTNPEKANNILEGWAGTVESDTDPDKLLEGYKKNFAKLLDLQQQKPVPPDPKPSSVKSWRSWLKQRNSKIPDAYTSQLWCDWLSGASPRFKDGWPTTELVACGEAKDPDKMVPGSWGYILYADGWTTGGPSGSEHGIPLV